MVLHGILSFNILLKIVFTCVTYPCPLYRTGYTFSTYRFDKLQLQTLLHFQYGCFSITACNKGCHLFPASAKNCRRNNPNFQCECLIFVRTLPRCLIFIVCKCLLIQLAVVTCRRGSTQTEIICCCSNACKGHQARLAETGGMELQAETVSLEFRGVMAPRVEMACLD